MKGEFGEYLTALASGKPTALAWVRYLDAVKFVPPSSARPRQRDPNACAHVLEIFPELRYCDAPVTRKHRCDEHAKRLPYWP